EGTGEQLPPEEEGTGEQLPPEEEGAGEQLPPEEEGTGEQLPPEEEGTGEQLPPKEEGTGEQLPPKEESTGEQLPPKEEGTDEQPPKPEEGTDEQPPQPEENTDEQLPPKEEGAGEQLPPKEEGTGEQLPPPKEGNGEQPPPTGNGNELLEFFEESEIEFEFDEPEDFEISIDEMENMHVSKITELNDESFKKMRPKHLQKMAPEALKAMTPNQRTNISKDAMDGLTKEHIDAMSKEELNDLFKADKLAGLNSEVIHNLGVEHLNENEVKQMSDEDASRFFHHLDHEKISNDDAKRMLPEGWEIDDETGELEPPLGAKLGIKEITQVFSPVEGIMPKITMPTVPDLNAGRGVGGSGTPVINHMKDSLSKSFNLDLLQRDTTGVLHVEEKNEIGEIKNEFAFIPDSNNITQVDKNNISSEISIGQGCFYNVTTSQGQKIKMLPTIKGPEDLSKVINNGQVVYGEYGEMFMNIPNNTRNDSSRSIDINIADSYIEPASDTWCVDTTDPTLCDFGITYYDTRAKQQIAKITYPDGTSQKLMPTVFKPDTLIENGLAIPGVEDIIFNINGTFTVSYQGDKYLLVPDSYVSTSEVPEGKTVKSKLVFNTNGGLIYTVGVDLSDSITQQLALKFNLSIEPFVEDLCEVTE
ncbi:hypothetical protein QUF74_04090, partial [Candidatus Halobeggiatoa sp. HSG11]|nr:hypothetical protein [Candidatus Halobeggiatoa sp. HSG11]